MKPRVALIGVSGFAGVYCEDFLRMAGEGKLAFTAATVINPDAELEKCERLKQAGCTIYADYREMLAADRNRLDLCVVPTGIHHHAPMTIAALEAGCHVLLEKPAAATVEEVGLMQTASEAADRFVAVGFQHMYAPETHRLKKALLGGVIGKVRTIKCLGLWPRDAGYYLRNDWAGRLQAGGRWVLDAPFNNAFAHWLNLMLFFSGTEPACSGQPVEMDVEMYRTREIASTDTACLRILTEAGVPILLWVSHSCRRDCGPVLEIVGSDGTIRWAGGSIRIQNRHGEASFSDSCETTVLRGHMLDSVFQGIAGSNPFLCGLDIAMLPTACSNAAFASSEIHTIDPDFLEVLRTRLGENPSISHLEETSVAAFVEARLWSEMRLPWTRPASHVSAVSLKSFPGLKVPSPHRDAVLSPV